MRVGPDAPRDCNIGAKKFRISGTARVDDRLIINVFKEAKLGEFGIIYGAVMKGEECIASGEIKVYHREARAEA